MGFTNIGNFGKKISEFNAQRREKNMEKLRIKAKNADDENVKLQEEMQLRKSLEKNTTLKQQVKEQKQSKGKGVIEKLSKLGDKFDKKSSNNKFDVLGNSDSKKKTPELFGKTKNTKFKF